MTNGIIPPAFCPTCHTSTMIAEVDRDSFGELWVYKCFLCEHTRPIPEHYLSQLPQAAKYDVPFINASPSYVTSNAFKPHNHKMQE
jgi:hypothetical protein